MIPRSRNLEAVDRGLTSWVGRLIAQRYRLIGRLGEGAVADVYLARHVLIERISAIKVLRPEFGGDAALRKRFLQEAKAVNRINHPNIVEISDYGETDGTAYLVMEYVPGDTVARHLTQGPLGFERSLQLGLQIASALSRAHEMGVVHRNLTPTNVLLVPRRVSGDIVKLTDFGVSKMLHGRSDTSPTLSLRGNGQKFHPIYVAPEVEALGALDPRSDLYSLGVMLYETTSGLLPAKSQPSRSGNSGPPSIIPAVSLQELVPGVPPLFDQIVTTLLAKDPDDRPRDAFETFEMLRRVSEEFDMPVSRASITSASRPTDPKPRRPGPHLLTVGFDRVGAIIDRAWGVVSAAAEKFRASGDDDPEARGKIDTSERLVRMVESLALIVATDAQTLAEVEERGRHFRRELGQAIDHVARQKSQSSGWAGTIAERHDFLKNERHSGAHPIPAAEAMLWEQAALEREEERAYAVVEALNAEFSRLQVELREANEALEQETETITAELDGHIAALRSLAVEAWMALQQAAEELKVELEVES